MALPRLLSGDELTKWPRHRNGVPVLKNDRYKTEPPCSPDEDAALEQAILRRNLDVPIYITRDGYIVDGHRRYPIYVKHGIREFSIRVLDGDDLRYDDISAIAMCLNCNRRQLSLKEKGEKCLPLLRAGFSLRGAAALLGVSHEFVRQHGYARATDDGWDYGRPVKEGRPQKLDSRDINILQQANDLGVGLAANAKGQRREILRVVREEAENRMKGAAPDPQFSIELADFRTFAWPDLDLIWTDPPWEDMEAYRDLAKMAVDRLKPGGLCVAYSGAILLRDVVNLMAEAGLTYVHTLAMVYESIRSTTCAENVKQCWRPVLVFSKGARRADPLMRTFSDVITVASPTTAAEKERGKKWHDWQQPFWPAFYWLKSLSLAGDVIADPFCGGGTFACVVKAIGERTCIATDKDEPAVLRSRCRLEEEVQEGAGFPAMYEYERRTAGRGTSNRQAIKDSMPSRDAQQALIEELS